MKPLDIYHLFPIQIARAEGSWLFTPEGDKYLDLYGGHAVISVGHGHPHYKQKIRDQLDRIGFYSNSVMIREQHELAEKLGALSGYPDYSLFLSNSGAEANENALKAASFVTGRRKVLAVNGSFHGRTSAAVEATDDHALSAPLNQHQNVTFTPINDLLSLASYLKRKEYAAFIIEGIQGVAGINIPDPEYLKAAEEMCRETGTVFIIDEVQSGYGRTGKFFAHQHAGVKGDIITVAKGMGNGFPVAGTLFNPSLELKKGQLGTTFGGNHLACAAALAVLDIIEQEKLIDHAAFIGNYFKQELSNVEGIKSIKGQGLMTGIELPGNGKAVRESLLHKHRIFTGNSSNKDILRILPALNVGKEHIDIFLKSLKHELIPTLQTL